MRVLAIAYCLPPLNVPGAMRSLKILMGLRENGVEVEALSIDPMSFAAPEPALAVAEGPRLIPRNLVNHVVWSPENHPLMRMIKKRKPLANMLYRFLEPKKREWLRPAFRVIERLDLARYDLLLTMSQPHANHLAGLRLKRTTGMPWAAYFSDPWSHNPYAQFGSPRIAAYHRNLERRVLEGADLVFFTCEEMLRFVSQDYSATLSPKGAVLPHSFVPEWYHLVPVRNARENAAIQMLHTGHFYGPRSPMPLLRALERLSRGGSLTNRLSVNFYGAFPDHARAEAERRGLGQVCHIHGSIPYLESLGRMMMSDVLLTIDAPLTSTAESVFLPSKLIDYLGAKKPVLALTPKRGASSRVVSEAGGVVCDIQDEEQIEETLRTLVAGKTWPSPTFEAVNSYHYLRVAEHALQRLSKL